LDNLALANAVLADIENKQRKSASEKITTLLHNNADLGKNWGAITRLALSIGEIDKALLCANKFLALSPNDTNRKLQVAGIYAESGKLKEAIERIVPIINNQPPPSIYHFLGTVYSQIGENKKAITFLNKALSASPYLGISWLTLAAIKKFTVNDPQFKTLCELETKMKGSDHPNYIPYWFALGKALLDINQPIEAFSKFSIGGHLMRTKNSYDKKSQETFINSIIQTQNKEYFEKLPNFDNEHLENIVFIIGLPRSGTTLLQQIISSHSKMNGGAETNCMTLAMSSEQSRLAGIESQPSSIQASSLTNIYLEFKHLIKQRLGHDNYVVDKTLNLNHQLGLIKTIFPNASIIKINRNSKENAWSCFRTFFNQGLPWSYKLEDIKHYFDLENKLFKHWQGLFGNKIIEVNYENLVTSPDKTISMCMEHIGLEFENNQLSFYKNKLPVQTASVGQVRNALNKDSLNIPKAIYSKFDAFK